MWKLNYAKRIIFLDCACVKQVTPAQCVFGNSVSQRKDAKACVLEEQVGFCAQWLL
jgi:hypothetical protein